MKVITISLSKLRNNEYFRFMMEIATIVNDAIISRMSVSPMNDNIGTLLDKLKDLLEKLDVAVVSLSKSELTEPVTEADINRDKTYRGFTLHVEAFSNSMDSDKVEAARRIQVLIQNYTDFRKRPLNEQSAIMDNFIQDLQSMQMENIETIGATEWITEMQETNNTLKNLMDERHNERVTQLREEVRTLRMQTDELYRQIISLLEIGNSLVDGAYTNLINSVNERVSYYKTTLATRKGRANAKKEEN